MFNKLKTLYSSFSNYINELLFDAEKRDVLLFEAVSAVFGIVSAFMSIINIKTGETILLISTAIFAFLCLVNCIINVKFKSLRKIVRILFQIEAPILFIFFIVSGHPQGFSAIWTALLPCCSLLLFKTKGGSLLSIIMFAILVFFFWVPFGQSLLRYEYSETFMLRFPLLYLAFFLANLVLAFLLEKTQNAYQKIYKYDPLTKALNRNGFSEAMSAALSTIKEGNKIGFIISDLDFFKTANDTYGHFSGDKILKETVDIMKSVTDYPICRWGGEEFAIFVSDGTKAEEIANNIREKIDDNTFIIDKNVEYHQTISLGVFITTYTANINTNDLYRSADRCLYKAKHNLRNCVVTKEK